MRSENALLRCTRGHPGTDMSLITIPEEGRQGENRIRTIRCEEEMNASDMMNEKGEKVKGRG